MEDRFRDRKDAGRELAAMLDHYADRDNVVVLALPRGGLPVGAEIARKLGAPLDVLVVRKLGVPGREELAMGAIASGGVRVINEEVVRRLGISDSDLDIVVQREAEELKRREHVYRRFRKPIELADKVVILVDDGLATGSSTRVAVKALKPRDPARIVLAVPVGASSVCRSFEGEVDEVVCARTPEPFYAVGACYGNFPQLTDADVRQILDGVSETTP